MDAIDIRRFIASEEAQAEPSDVSTWTWMRREMMTLKEHNKEMHKQHLERLLEQANEKRQRVIRQVLAQF